MEVHGYSTLLREVPGPGMVARRLVTDTGLHNDDLGAHLAELREWVKLKGGRSPGMVPIATMFWKPLTMACMPEAQLRWTV